MARILVIEDDATIRDVLQYALAAAGHSVRTAADGFAGILSVEEDPPELVILDFKMPRMDGSSVLRRIKKSRPDLPVFFFTVYGDFPDKRGLSEADGCFVKSSDLSPLLEAVARAVGETSATTPT
jgi:CheY-like chemotaxis protein